MMKKNEDPKLKQLEEEAGIWKEKYLRALADYQNLEKRIANRRNDDVRYAAKNIVLKLLPVLDIFENVEKTLHDQGLQLALRQFREVLTNEKVEKMEVIGKKFDPHRMECVEVVPGEKDDMVVDEVRPGYMILDTVMRVARVKVGRTKVQQKEEKEQSEEMQKSN